LPINPPEEVQEMLLMDLLSARAAAKANKKRKAGTADVSADGASVDSDKKAKKEEARKVAKRLLDPNAGSRDGTGTPRSNDASPAPTRGANGLEGGKGEAQKAGMPTTVKQKLAEQEQKRLAAQANMSEAVRAMFKSSRDPNVKDETTEFFGRTYTRVSHA
jgi:hypothetical protein